MITQQSFQQFIKDAPNAVVVMLYSLSVIHEKYKISAWTKEELNKRGFKDEDFREFETNFADFYLQMINQTDL